MELLIYMHLKDKSNMSTKLFYIAGIILFLFTFQGKAQDDNTVLSPILRITGESNKLKEIHLDNLKINVNVVGNLTTTTFEMQFYNPNNRVMEGELVFPLQDGATVSRFAMDVNGKIREGVPVEKNKGQQVFESIERRQVDPGLLELVEGNTFKTRVYPIPASGYKTIIIAFDEELQSKGERSIFSLPLFFNKEVKNFSLEVEVFKQKLAPILLNNKFENLAFNNWEENYKAEAHYENYLLNHQLKFAVPKTNSVIGVYTERGVRTNDNYFYVVTNFDDLRRPKKVPDSISIFWDVSSSAKKRKLKLEVELLEKYLAKMGNGNVELFFFSNEMEKVGTFSVLDGKSDVLLELLKNIDYDGGTQLSSIDFSKAKGKEIMLFSDGMGTFGNNNTQKSSKPLIVINSCAKADHSLLNYLAISSGGNYINLQKSNTDEALVDITNESLRLMNIAHSNSVSEIYPSVKVKVSNTFSCAGKLLGNQGDLTINLGYGAEVIYSLQVKIDGNSFDSKGMIEKTWASKKLWELNLMYDKNKEEIKQIGKDFSIVTKNTSLIILETVEDYIEYKIEPPKELLSEYLKLTKEQEKEFENKEKNTIDRVVEMYKAKIEWWKREINPIKPNPARDGVDNSNLYRGTSLIEEREYSSETKQISGIVYDEEGMPLPGVTIVIKATNRGTITDLEGRFSFSVPENAILQYKYIGFQTVEQDVSGITNTEVGLTPDNVSLDEVVVTTGYGFTRRNPRASRPQPVEDIVVMEEAEVSEDIAFSTVETKEKKTSTDENAKGAIFLKPWTPDAPYLKALEKYEKKDLYTQYLKLKEEYKDIPSFYTDVSNLLYTQGLHKEAVRVVSNLAEIQLSSHELLRVLAHKLEHMKEYDASIEVYKKLLEIRKEEPQSYRDLALVYSKNEQFQEAVDIIWVAVKTSWDGRFPGIEAIMVTEMNSIIAKGGSKVKTNHIDERLLENLPVDIRVVLNWDADNTDMDLWVTDPRGEKCDYSHKETLIGGLMSNDFTQGYGPEEFLLKKAIEGKYKIEANYYGSSQQKIAGPVTIYLQLYLNYGKPNEELKEIILRLSDSKEVVEIGEFEF